MSKKKEIHKNIGKVIEVIGPVVDIEFSKGELPEIYNAVEIVSQGFRHAAADQHHLRGAVPSWRKPGAHDLHASHRRPGAGHAGP